jgi:hypothetical protein
MLKGNYVFFNCCKKKCLMMVRANRTCNILWHDIKVLCWVYTRRLGSVDSSFVDGNEVLGSTKGVGMFDQLCNYRPPNNGSIPWNSQLHSQSLRLRVELRGMRHVYTSPGHENPTHQKSNNPNEKPAGDWAIYYGRSNHCTDTHKMNGFTSCEPHMKLPRLSSFAAI